MLYCVAATPEPLSDAATCTLTASLFQLFEVPVIAVTGEVRSILTAGLLVAVVDRPAPLVTVVVLVRFSPSPVITVSAGAVGMPDSGSLAIQCTVTSPRYQPPVPGAVVSPAGAAED